jgi:hypothetical protein
MQRALPVLALVLGFAGAAMADDKSSAAKVQVGTTVICDTQQQMERFVVLFDGDYAGAMNKVNAEERNPTACIGATMAYMRGGELSKAKSSQGTYHIIRVLVVGINTPQGFQAVQPAPFFSIEKSEEIEI